ncbi:MAG: circularly permuted type 2 ATP-grasp protein [Turneriella sp.]|nr:circularly permuted type 2 ATP-grasp protein [Turneriella sp.]
MDLSKYDIGPFHDEMFVTAGNPRAHAQAIARKLAAMNLAELKECQLTSETALRRLGITFNVYGAEGAQERIMPFDVIPRVIAAEEWDYLEKGLVQRITALNLFLEDLYHDKQIIRDGIIPADVIYSSKGYLKECEGFSPPKKIWVHITGTDLICDRHGRMHVLEDNLRCPSGVSYVLENRELMKGIMPDMFYAGDIRPVSDYPFHLSQLMQYVSGKDRPVMALLTPGIYNSAYFEHSFLAQQMGIELVEGRDLIVQNEKLMMRTTQGLTQIDVLYRRIDDTFIDPTVFNPDSVLGAAGMFGAYRSGNLALVNAPGTGVADDKVVYAYVPDMIKYYLKEDMIIPNVDTYLCWRDRDRDYVLNNIEKLVVKAANEAGGYGMLVGPHSTKAQQEDFKQRVAANPRNYIAQPTISLSRTPTLIGDALEGRHVDLRPYILYGEKIHIIPGGLTRVALKQGSLVVNSSQGGGSKDTWVMR